MDTQTPIKVTFLILNYKTPHLLKLGIKGLANLELPFAIETIVVDNASGDGSAEMVDEYFVGNPDYEHINLRLIKNPKNTGHARGNNTGIDLAKGEYVVIQNPDIIYTKAEDVTKPVEYMDAHKEVALLGPKLYNTDGTVQASCMRYYKLFTPLYRRTPLGRLPWAKRDLDRFLMKDFDHAITSEVDWLLGACIYMRQSVLNDIGPLDPDFFLYFADLEWCQRAKKRGHKVVYFVDEAMHIFHYHRRESDSGPILKGLFSYVTRIHIKDWITYLKKERELYS